MSIARSLLLRASRSTWLAEQFRRRAFAKRAVRRFMPGEDHDSAQSAAAEFARSGIGTVLTSLGERIESLEDAAAVRDHYLHVLDTIRERTLPAQISVKLTHLGLSVDRAACTQNVIALVRRAEESGSFVWIDMEESPYVDDTLEVFRAARAQHQKVGVCLQSYLRRAPADLEGLLQISPAIRLVKGAYREPDSYGSHWFPWYVRRLAERPANVWFVLRNLWP